MTDDTTSASAQADFEAWWETGAGIRAADAKGWKGAALAAWQARAAVGKESLTAASAPTGLTGREDFTASAYNKGWDDHRDYVTNNPHIAPTGQGAGLTDAEIRELWDEAEMALNPIKFAKHVIATLQAKVATRSAGDGQAVAFYFNTPPEWDWRKDARKIIDAAIQLGAAQPSQWKSYMEFYSWFTNKMGHPPQPKDVWEAVRELDLDAKRYRWMRENGAGIHHRGGFQFGIAAYKDSLDFEVDAAIDAERNKGGKAA